jgi:CBS-domain-containing membrane protein
MNFKSLLKWLFAFGGIDVQRISHRERLVSALGGFLGIWAIIYISYQFVNEIGAALIVASMGASAVLVFGVPHGKLSQPCALLGGHFISACIGVTVASHVADTTLAAALAVGLAIGAMHYLRCLHPPGGASALAAVISGPAVHDLGYQFVLTPVMLNAVVIFLAAMIVNAFFSWRRYPAGLNKLVSTRQQEPSQSLSRQPDVQVEDIRYAIEKMELIIDVSDNDLGKIYLMARQHASEKCMSIDQINLGKCYSNGGYGKEWSVRQVVDESIDKNQDRVIYKVVAGHDRRNTGVCTRQEFACWARYEVFRNENSWQKVSDQETGTQEQQ